MIQRIYISGCGGMLGEAFHALLKDYYNIKYTDIDVNDKWLTYCDVRLLDCYRKDVAYFRPGVLIHLAALTDLEYCEDNPSEAYNTNTIGVENAVYIANELQIPLVYISTAGIFDGQKQRYDDWDTPNPINVYGRSKYMGERFVVENCHRYLVCRAGWMMGGGVKDKKFVAKILKQIDNFTIRAVDDKSGTPTYTHDFARNVMLLIEKKMWGVYNMVCSGETSRFEVAQEIVKLTGSSALVVPSTSDGFPEYYAPRPKSEMLVNTKLNLRGLNIMRDWHEALKEYLHG